MEYSNSTRDKILLHLERLGPSTSAEIESALSISQPQVSKVLRGEPVLGAITKFPALIYNKKDANTKGKPPQTIRAVIAENLRLGIMFYRRMRAIDPDDYESLDDLTNLFIKASLRLTETIRDYRDEGQVS